MKFAVIVCCLSGVLCACAYRGDFRKGEWIDLSYEFSEDTIYWNESDNFKKEVIHEEWTQAGYYYSAYKFCTPEHGGTHLDAPIHFAEERQTVSEIPLSRLIAEGVKIDVSEKAGGDYQVSVEDILVRSIFQVWIGKRHIIENSENCCSWYRHS